MFLMFIGRVGKLLKEREIDPATARFLPGSLHVVAQLNPDIPLTQNQWDQLFDEATKWIVENYKFVMSTYGATIYCSRYCMKYCTFLFLKTKLISHYFERLDKCTTEEWDKYKNLLTGGTSHGKYNQPDYYDLTDMCGSRTRFDIASDELVSEGESQHPRLITPVNDCPKPEETDGYLHWYTFKLSQFGRKGVMRYFREQADRKSTFEIGLDKKTLAAPVGGSLYRYEHTNIRRTNRVLKNTLTKIMQGVVDEVYSSFYDYFVEQEVRFNGITLSRPVKELLASKLHPHVFINGLTSISKVFQTLRDNINDIDAVAAVLLTAADEQEREAGRALYEIQTELENDEEDDED